MTLMEVTFAQQANGGSRKGTGGNGGSSKRHWATEHSLVVLVL